MCWSGGYFGTLENLGGLNLVRTQVVTRAAAFVTTFSHVYTQRRARKTAKSCDVFFKQWMFPGK